MDVDYFMRDTLRRIVFFYTLISSDPSVTHLTNILFPRVESVSPHLTTKTSISSFLPSTIAS